MQFLSGIQFLMRIITKGKQPMKKTLIVLILLCVTQLFAESVFLKNGSIVEGTIEKETSSSIRIKSANGLQDISKKEVIRSLTSDSYKKKLYIYKKDLSLIEGYIVDENRSQYTIRKELLQCDETVLLKSEIEFYSRMDISGCSAINEGEYNAVETPYDWFYIELSAAYLLNPFALTAPNKGDDAINYYIPQILSMGITNSFDKWYHLGVNLSLEHTPKNVPEGYRMTTVFSPLVTGGVNFIFNDRIGIQPYAGVGYNNGLQYALGLSIPLRFYSYHWVSLFVLCNRTLVKPYEEEEGDDNDIDDNVNGADSTDSEREVTANSKYFNLFYVGIKFNL